MNENRPTAVRVGWKRPVLLLVAGCAISAGALTGCGSSSAAGTAAAGTSNSAMSMPSSSASSDMPATATTIMIENFQYKTPASVRPGATVRVMNMDGEAHTLTADTGNAFGVTAPAGKTVTFTVPASPGRYAFHCAYHSTMHGTLVVQ